MTDLESLILTEARRQSVKPNAAAVRQAGIDLAGATLNSDGLVSLPGRGSISVADYTRSLRAAMPESFTAIGADTPDTKPAGTTLTEIMRQELEATRQQRRLPSDWRETRSRYAEGSVTGQHLAERERTWR